jgi:hypothetical protein
MRVITKANIHLLGEVDPVMFSVNVCIARIPHQHLQGCFPAWQIDDWRR